MEPPYTIRNRSATEPEYFVSKILDKYKVRYYFQFLVGAGAGVRGSMWVDFLIYNPLKTPLEVQGNYWHTGAMGEGDKLRLSILRRLLEVPKVLEIWGNECETLESTEQALRKLGIV